MQPTDPTQLNDQPGVSPHSQRGARWLVIAGLILLTILGMIFIAATNLNETSDKDKSDSSFNAAADLPTITITDDGFEPEEILVEPNARIRWVNNTDEPHFIASGPFPDNDAYSELNATQPIGPGETFEATIGGSGSFDYVDNYNPLLSGLITVYDDSEEL